MIIEIVVCLDIRRCLWFYLDHDDLLNTFTTGFPCVLENNKFIIQVFEMSLN